jgi:EAL domain-containing protein (putative c-di-GMP-specific phosphodiesterase class I)
VEFIPLAEAQGEIIAIGEWVLRQACAQLSNWRIAQPALRVSVNLSAVQLADDAALDGLCAVLAASDLPCGAVELELTESLLVDRSEAMLSRMRRLRAAGFGLAIDDFGVGYSSLAYLDSFPITTLKIDRAFVQPLLQGGHSTAIARAIVAIGMALGVDVVAEGIESDLQADVLRELGCLLGQGYLFAKPLEEAAALAWVQARGDEGAAVSIAVREAPVY